tara:strand:- start:56 stop:232 length:177 start_codon:yes stop_codon:yes gene_type:complete
MIKYIAVQKDTPNFARAWGEAKTHEEAILQCEIAIREKYLGKLSVAIMVLLVLIRDIK